MNPSKDAETDQLFTLSFIEEEDQELSFKFINSEDNVEKNKFSQYTDEHDSFLNVNKSFFSSEIHADEKETFIKITQESCKLQDLESNNENVYEHITKDKNLIIENKIENTSQDINLNKNDENIDNLFIDDFLVSDEENFEKGNKKDDFKVFTDENLIDNFSISEINDSMQQNCIYKNSHEFKITDDSEVILDEAINKKKSKIKCIEFDSVNDEIKNLDETKLQFEKSFLKENILNNENNDLSNKKPNEDLSLKRNPRLIESKDESFESDFFESSDFRKKYNNYEKKEPEKNNFFYDNKINKKGTNDIKISFVNDDKNEGHFEEKLIDSESISDSGDDCIYEKDIVGINSIYENDEFDDLFSSDLNIESAKNIKLNQDDVKDESIISEKDLDSDVIESIKNKNEIIIEELNFNSEIFDEIDQDEIENQDNNLCIAKFKKATLEIKKENKISQNNKKSFDLNFNSAEEDLFSTIDEIYNKSDNIENNNDFISKENNNFFNNNKNAFFTGFVNGLNKKISIKEESLIIANKLNEEITEKEMQFEEDKQKSIFKNDFENEIDKLIKEKCKIRKKNIEIFSLENNFSQQKHNCKILNTSQNFFDKTENEGRLSNVLLTKKGDISINKNEYFDMKINKKQCFDSDSNFLQKKTNFIAIKIIQIIQTKIILTRIVK